jgi:hypothetical protein
VAFTAASSGRTSSMVRDSGTPPCGADGQGERELLQIGVRA